MKHTYATSGVCARQITFEIDEQGKLHNVSFLGGCPGNLKSISKLVEGKDANEVALVLKGNQCGPRPSSCADQLAKAIMEVL